MRALILLAVLVLARLAAVSGLSGGDRVVLAWAMEGQRAAQGGMGRALAALRTGDAAAVVPLLSVSVSSTGSSTRRGRGMASS
jgi:hypothetical protein